MIEFNELRDYPGASYFSIWRFDYLSPSPKKDNRFFSLWF